MQYRNLAKSIMLDNNLKLEEQSAYEPKKNKEFSFV